MANSIETHARVQLSGLEDIVNAMVSLSAVSASLQGGDVDDLAVVFGYLGGELRARYEPFHEMLNTQVFPLVADVKLLRA